MTNLLSVTLLIFRVPSESRAMVTLSDTYAGCGEFSAEAVAGGFSPVKNVNFGGRKVLLNGQ
jgi:hypothetical protein